MLRAPTLPQILLSVNKLELLPEVTIKFQPSVWSRLEFNHHMDSIYDSGLDAGRLRSFQTTSLRSTLREKKNFFYAKKKKEGKKLNVDEKWKKKILILENRTKEKKVGLIMLQSLPHSFPHLLTILTVTTDDLQSNHSEIRYHNVFSSPPLYLYIFFLFLQASADRKATVVIIKKTFLFLLSCCWVWMDGIVYIHKVKWNKSKVSERKDMTGYEWSELNEWMNENCFELRRDEYGVV